MTTLMQVFSRYAIVWGVTGPFPGVAREGPAYAAMLVAWSATEVIRYSYFALTLSGVFPAALHWLRYHAFFVLYPLGINSEAWLIWRAVTPAAEQGLPWFSTALFLYVVAVYPPCKSPFPFACHDVFANHHPFLLPRFLARSLLYPLHPYDGPATQGHEGRQGTGSEDAVIDYEAQTICR